MGQAVQRPRTGTRCRIILGPGLGSKGSYALEPWEGENIQGEDGYEYNDWDPAAEPDDWEEEADLLGRRV